MNPEHNFERRDEPSELEPRNAEERNLWERIGNADHNIQLTLKRINRVGKDRFPKVFLQTIESCSGRVDSDGKIDYELIDENHKQKREPSVHFMFKSEKSRDNALPYFRQLFRAAVDATNKAFGVEVIGYGAPGKWHHTDEGEYIVNLTEIHRGNSEHETKVYDRPAASYSFNVLEEQRAYEVLKTFWDAVDSELSKLDGLQIVTDRPKESFYSRPNSL